MLIQGKREIKEQTKLPDFMEVEQYLVTIECDSSLHKQTKSTSAGK
jgi:hypothetical protein